MTTSVTKERDYVRELARQVAEIAARPEQEAARKRWRDVNALRRPDRAPVWCKPVKAWEELLPDQEVTCEDRYLRSMEVTFRRALLKVEIGDDEPLDGEIGVSAAFDLEPQNTWGVDIGRVSSGVDGGAWAYDPPLKTEADFEKLRLPTYTYSDARTQERLSRAHVLLGDILQIKLACGPPLHSILCGYAAYLRGLGRIMIDMIAEPELMHRLMAHVRDGVIQATRQVEASGLLAPNNSGPMTCSDPVGPQNADGRTTCENLWIMTNSQEFDPVSPAMWEEFLLNYQMPILAMYGLSGYGCCENLTRKIDGVLSIPNLRIFVCSAWTDLDVVLDKVSADYVIMWRQKASDVVFPDDAGQLERDLEEGLRKLQGRPYQIVLRELQTLAGHPDRLHVWTRLATELAAKYA